VAPFLFRVQPISARPSSRSAMVVAAAARRIRHTRPKSRLAAYAAASLIATLVAASSLFSCCFVGVGRAAGESSVTRRAAVAAAEVRAPQAGASLDLIKSQNKAGHAMKDLGLRLQSEEFAAKGLDGRVQVAFDGLQRLRRVDVAGDALEAAGGKREALAEVVLTALQEAHDSSESGTKGDVWQLYSENNDLLQAPLVQIGAGSTVEDLWANVTQNEETVRLTEEVFAKFDEDGDGYWNLKETSSVQMATEGTEMAEDAFNALIIAAAPDGGRNLSEDDLGKGLSKAQVIELYTDANRQRALGFVLDIYKDHAKIFKKEPGASDSEGDGAATSEAAETSGASAIVD